MRSLWISMNDTSTEQRGAPLRRVMRSNSASQKRGMRPASSVHGPDRSGTCGSGPNMEKLFPLRRARQGSGRRTRASRCLAPPRLPVG